MPLDTAFETAARVIGPMDSRAGEVLTPEALALVAELHRALDGRRKALLAAREARQARFDAGELPDFRADTAAIRDGDWRVAPIPADLLDRRRPFGLEKPELLNQIVRHSVHSPGTAV